MNNVIRFPPASRRCRLATGDRGAQILFFTGVRYQRMSEDPRTQARQSQDGPCKRQAAESASGRKSQR
jgi:hypothetical protein